MQVLAFSKNNVIYISPSNINQNKDMSVGSVPPGTNLNWSEHYGPAWLFFFWGGGGYSLRPYVTAKHIAYSAALLP